MLTLRRVYGTCWIITAHSQNLLPFKDVWLRPLGPREVLFFLLLLWCNNSRSLSSSLVRSYGAARLPRFRSSPPDSGEVKGRC